MVKPFDTKEVVARIMAVLRRCTVTTSQTESPRASSSSTTSVST
jgi:DNA-binding response OmpR family regulator